MNNTGKLKLKELIAMGVGGMIGGGIFSVLGIAIDIAGHAAPISFALGSVIAFLSGYSYIKLSLAFPNDGASYTYLEYAYPNYPNISGFFGWAVILGYIGTLALYAFTFGAYGADLLGHSSSSSVREILSICILLSLMFVNLHSVSTSGITADLLVYTKILILAFFALIGLYQVEFTNMSPVFNHGVGSVFMSGALIFVAYEGFQLITNQISESENIKKNIPRSIYASILITSMIYISIAVIATSGLTASKVQVAKEYALAIVADPFIGKSGRVLIGIAALLATSSAINSTIFGASRMMSVMAESKRMPKILSQKNQKNLPCVSIWVLTILGIVFSAFNSLETIASFSSIVFLLVCGSVSAANFTLRNKTDANPFIVIISLILIAITILLLIIYLYHHNIKILLSILGLLGLVSISEIFYRKYLSGILF